MRHKFLLLYTWFIRTLLFFLPDSPSIMRIRGFFYGLGMKKCGKDFQVTHDARITTLEEIVIGKHCFIGNSTLIFASGEIIISDEVQIGPHSVIVSDNHTSVNGSFRYGKESKGAILIGKGAWVSANCTIIKDSVLPEGRVLGATSLLNKTFSTQYSLYAVVPATFIKTIN